MALPGTRRPIVSYVNLSMDLVKEIFIIVGTWAAFAFFVILVLYGVFFVIGMRQLDFILMLWVSVLLSSMFAVPYDEYWGLKRFRVLFGVTASLVITSFILLTASVLIQNLLAFHVETGYVIPGIFISGIILAIITGNYWSFDKLESIKNLTVYAFIGESLIMGLGDAIAGMQNVDPLLRGAFLVAVLIIIAILGIAIIKIKVNEWKPW